ncbi:MAG: PEGA domain-containing protein, partial [Myxococcota bacterium]|nr:PEGA domain-containing protein [Myxococcota bacterium]
SELDALDPAPSAGSLALGDTEAPPSTGAATRLENPAPSSTADELDALMSGGALGDDPVADTGEVDRLEAPESLAPPDEQEAPTSGPMEFQADEAMLGGSVQERTGEVPAISREEGDEEEDGSEATAAIESPLWSQAPNEADRLAEGTARTAAPPAPSDLLDTHPEQDDSEDRTAAIAAPSLAGHDRTAATRAPSELDEHGDGRGDTGVSEAPAGLQEEDEEVEDRAEQTRPERSPRRAPAAAPMSQRAKLIALGGAATTLVLVVIGLVLSLGGEPAGALMVLADPSSARITVGGREIKSGVVLTGLEAGEHELVVSAPGFKTHRAKLKTTDSQNTTRVALVSEAAAEPAPEVPQPQVAQAAEPVAVEEKATAQSPVTDEKPEPSAPVAETRVASASKPVAQEAPAPEIRQTRTARRRTGQLAITSSPMGAEIFVNGRSTGRKTPVAFGSALTLPAGSNMLVLKSGQLKFVKEIMIEADEMNTVRNAVLE